MSTHSLRMFDGTIEILAIDLPHSMTFGGLTRASVVALESAYRSHFHIPAGGHLARSWDVSVTKAYDDNRRFLVSLNASLWIERVMDGSPITNADETTRRTVTIELENDWRE